MNRRAKVCGSCIYASGVGVLLIGLGWLATKEGSTPAATALFVLGGGALVAAPFFSRLEGTLRIGPLELTLQRQVTEAARSASESSLEGVLPLLSRDDFEVAKLRLPSRFAGRRLIDPGLGFLRKKLKVSVVGIRDPQQDRWLAGGLISEVQLSEDTELLVAGHPDVLSYLRFLIASDDDELWQRVTDAAIP